jgi:hypothetical protein
VNKSLGKLFTTTKGHAMKKIVLYCGIEGDDNVYVRNGREYLSMTNEEKVAVLTGFISELSQELEFVAKQLNAQETSSEALSLAQ